MLWLAVVVYVARPVELVCFDHQEVPKSPIRSGEKKRT